MTCAGGSGAGPFPFPYTSLDAGSGLTFGNVWNGVPKGRALLF